MMYEESEREHNERVYRKMHTVIAQTVLILILVASIVILCCKVLGEKIAKLWASKR